MVSLKTFDGEVVSPEDDSAILKTLMPDGIISGCDFSKSDDNKIHISDGYIVFNGRNIQIVNEVINAKLATEGTVDGCVYLKLDLNNHTTPVILENKIAKQDFDDNEMLLAKYKTTATGIFDLERNQKITNNQLIDRINNISNGANPTIGGKLIKGEVLWEGEWKVGSIHVPNSSKYRLFTIETGNIADVISFSQGYIDETTPGFASMCIMSRNSDDTAVNTYSALIYKDGEIWSLSQPNKALSHYVGADHGSFWDGSSINRISGII